MTRGIVLYLAALPSLSSTYNDSAGLQAAAEPSRNVWDFKIIADLDTQSKYGQPHSTPPGEGSGGVMEELRVSCACHLLVRACVPLLWVVCVCR